MKIFHTELKTPPVSGRKVVVIITNKEEKKYCSSCPNTTGYLIAKNEKGKSVKIEVEKIECPCQMMRARCCTIDTQTAQDYQEAGLWETFLETVEREVIINGAET